MCLDIDDFDFRGNKLALVWKPFENPWLARVNVKINWKSHVWSRGAPTNLAFKNEFLKIGNFLWKI